MAESGAIERAGRHVNAAGRLVGMLRFVAWVGLVVGGAAAIYTWVDNHDSFGPGGVTTYLLDTLVPLVTGWGVLLGLATLIELRVDGILVEDDDWP